MKELQLIQSALKAPKGQMNKFGNYKYRSCEDILESVKPLLSKWACYLTINDEIVLIGERYYVKATARIARKEFDDDSGKVVSVDAIAYAREPENKKGMDEAQITGATSSYARKYALNGLFCIDDTKDADTMKPPAPVVKIPKRSDVNKALQGCKTVAEIDDIADKVNKKYGDIATLKTGHKSEIWSSLFETHYKRVNGQQPFDANEHPDDLQKRFNSMVDTADSWATYDFCEKLYNDNKALKVTANLRAIQDLAGDLVNRLGDR